MSEHLELLKTNNPTIEFVEEENFVNITKMWNDETFSCRFGKNEDFSDFGKIFFPIELSAMYHIETKKLEVIFAPLISDNSIIQRKFNFFYNGIEFQATFENPTNIFQTIAKGFQETDTDNSSDTDFRNLRKFRDYYNQETLPSYIKDFFDNKTPINFFISGDFDSISNDFVSLAKHLNFYMSYYHRETPNLVIFEQDLEEKTYETPCYTTNGNFPEIINFSKIDPILLDLFQISRKTSNVRLKFIFYFQVLEYCAYYHLNDDLKKRLTNIIKRPDLLNNTNNYSKLIIEEFKDHFKQNDDSAKLEKLINDFCTWNDVKLEIEANKDYFANDLVFEGGLKIQALINANENLENEPKGIMKSVKSNIEKIRNVLVHLRESRENKVILPTPNNNNLLIPYLHLVQRIAEKIAIHHE